ncbi:Frag1/DRAM/Sfk1 family-domain-containing protein [Massariosphaeria phaeospora]|uniref:Frag1/DRAM/Sfk1 family-domain-containing protein n=1 Tax=Massariosphaeria phaeospora TaxID=100035 RepID=A0A7C8ICP9_9PLEO|nr:Frag1/DRAM/Sfk1 family-domain-containing protein [Massariosphaeria phaeospora]
MWFLSYWTIPLFSALVWLAMLIAMLTTWTSQGRPHYSSMDPSQRIAYISDVGAQGLKPLFIAMSTVTVVSFDIAFLLERWLRHTGKLAPNTSIWQKIYSGLSIVFAIAGAAGLILLSIFDALRHNRLHNIFLAVFIGGYVLSAVFICWEYQRLGIHFREHSVLRYSFWIKLSFILIEVALAIAFGVTQRQKLYNAAAVLEWTVAFIYFFYVLSFFIDFMPAVRSKGRQSRTTEMDMATAETGMGDGAADDQRYFRGAATNGTTNDASTNGYDNGYTNGIEMHPGYPNGNGAGYVKPVEPAPLPSRNF